jgi:hypothetical protein
MQWTHPLASAAITSPPATATGDSMSPMPGSSFAAGFLYSQTRPLFGFGSRRPSGPRVSALMSPRFVGSRQHSRPAPMHASGNRPSDTNIRPPAYTGVATP